MNTPAERVDFPGIVPLAEADDEARYGGKAASLARSLRAGLPVPPGVALDAEAAAAVATGDASALARLFALASDVEEPVAVRSSAIGEDSAEASFAGQHETVLGVAGMTAIAEAVRRVRDSGGRASAVAYRELMGAGGEAQPVADASRFAAGGPLFGGFRVAVVVQEMLAPELAGVLFTRHPVTGADEIVVEAVKGLGETLVSGRASPARYRLSRGGELLEVVAGRQDTVLRLGADGTVEEEPNSPPDLDAALLDAGQLVDLVALADACRALHGEDVDVEWAVSGGCIRLLQARPITAAGGGEAEEADALGEPGVLHDDPGRGILWSRVNIGEAMPGTLTPLTREFHRDSCELTPVRMFQRMGVLPRGPVRRPSRPEDRPTGFFCGKAAANVDFLRAVTDAIPGTSGDAFEEGMLGRVRAGVASRPKRSRYPVVAAKLAGIVVVLPREFERLAEHTHAWWRERTTEAETADLRRAVEIFDDACETNARVTEGQGLIAMLSAGFWDPVARLVRELGTPDDLLALTAGYGNVREAKMLEALWEVSRDRAELSDFVGRYGYMGPLGGELVSPSWRENPTPLERIVATYRTLPESESPAARQERTRAAFLEVKERLLARAGRLRGFALRAALRLAARMLPEREVGKSAMLQGSDVARSAARRAGVLLAERGSLDEPGDVHFLTREELRAAVDRDGDWRRVASGRRELHAAYERIELPDFFTSDELDGIIARARDRAPSPAPALGSAAVSGMGVSRGRVEGVARVVIDPANVARFDPGDVLVCRTTDPGWVGLFSIAGAMVVDVGGMLSHSAIIARELGIPAVVNTRSGTGSIPDGARVIVDGSTGEVVVVDASRAEAGCAGQDGTPRPGPGGR